MKGLLGLTTCLLLAGCGAAQPELEPGDRLLLIVEVTPGSQVAGEVEVSLRDAAPLILAAARSPGDRRVADYRAEGHFLSDPLRPEQATALREPSRVRVLPTFLVIGGDLVKDAEGGVRIALARCAESGLERGPAIDLGPVLRTRTRAP